MLRRISIYEIDKDVTKQYNDYVLKPINDKETLNFLATNAGINKTFKGDIFYKAVDLDIFLGRKSFFNLIATIDNKIYKIYFKFRDDDRSECMAFRKEIREYIYENMPSQEFINPKIIEIESGSLSIWQFDWGNFLLEELSLITEGGHFWSTAISVTSKGVRNAKKLSFFDRLF